MSKCIAGSNVGMLFCVDLAGGIFHWKHAAFGDRGFLVFKKFDENVFPRCKANF